jgi:predicted NACHT family NTPase
MFQGEFTRCDIQPFDENDRRQFLRNWVALLFKVSREQVLAEGTEARREFDSLTRGVESNDRIRPLAVNPLLLTVIAIVHWNRKRLPEQRVDLYDECVDVLLGQRKEAERVQVSRRVGSLDEQQEQQQYEERAWVRKRFAEIAMYILSSEGDEVTKTNIVKLLIPRFLDQGASNEERATARAELFLERQELRSGLLVSRRSQSYRFVHLTFQEYLAAWHLSNQELDDALPLILPHIRRQKWFEVLQLLGGEWAKQSDEKLDRCLAWLLDQQGTTVAERAPVVALCANIVKDATGVAELKPQTRQAYRAAVQGTLAAFRPHSGVPGKTQLEILEALGQLGAAVKPHLINATTDPDIGS